MESNVKASLVISTYNKPDVLEIMLMSLMRQRVMPHEIIIADDGSKEATKTLIDSYRSKFPIPLIHIWHEDNGFRLSEIRNKAIAASTGNYIIQTDGDVILDKYFVKDHIEMAEAGCLVCGSRVTLNEKFSIELVKDKSLKIKFSGIYNDTHSNALRSRLLRTFLAKRFGQKKLHRLRGCNMAFWKSEFIAVNGYNEQLTGWGHEDSELAYRMYNNGAQKKSLKFGGVLYHIYHPFISRENEKEHWDALYKVRDQHIKWCENGIDKHLNK